MPSYLYQVSYTGDAWANLAKNPQNRMDAVRPAVEALRGRIVSFYWAFGDYDIVAIVDFPDNAAAASFSMAASAGGAVKAIKTTPLMTNEEAMAAMGKAAGSAYRPPS